jgi:hypothetical protein
MSGDYWRAVMVPEEHRDHIESYVQALVDAENEDHR